MVLDSAHRGDNHLIGQLAADGEAGAAHRTDQIPAIREFPDLELLAESEVTEPITGWTAQHLDPHVTTDARLVQRHGAVRSKIVGEGVNHALNDQLLRPSCNRKIAVV